MCSGVTSHHATVTHMTYLKNWNRRATMLPSWDPVLIIHPWLGLFALLRRWFCWDEAGQARMFTDVCRARLCVGGGDSALQALRASGRMDTAATSITSGEYHRLADVRSRPRQKHAHTHAQAQACALAQITTLATSVYSGRGRVNLEEEELRQNVPERCFWSCQRGGCMCPVLQNRRSWCYVIGILVGKITHSFKSDKIPPPPFSMLQRQLIGQKRRQK